MQTTRCSSRLHVALHHPNSYRGSTGRRIESTLSFFCIFRNFTQYELLLSLVAQLWEYGKLTSMVFRYFQATHSSLTREDALDPSCSETKHTVKKLYEEIHDGVGVGEPCCHGTSPHYAAGRPCSTNIGGARFRPSSRDVRCATRWQEATNRSRLGISR